MKVFKKPLNRFLRTVKDLWLEFGLVIGARNYRVAQPEKAEVVVSMTSYPARIKFAWISLETLFRQDYSNYAVVLVLARDQFPEGRLPRRIMRLQERGLEVIWVDQDGKSADHIWPAYSRFRHARIVSVDDDKFFPRDLLAQLIAQSNIAPGAIVGARGWEMAGAGESLSFGEEWVRARPCSPSPLLFMPPGNGSLYPPGSLPELAGDYDLMKKVCPTADDVWFWAMGWLAGTESRCLGLSAHRPVSRQLRTESLVGLNAGPTQFRAVLEHFGIENEVLGAIRKVQASNQLDES